MSYTFEDKQLVKLFTEKEKELKAGRALEEKKNKIEQEQRKIGLKLNRIKEMMIPLVEAKREELGITEFEEITTLDVKKGKVVVGTQDLVEEYKKVVREQREMRKNANATEDKTEDKAVSKKS